MYKNNLITVLSTLYLCLEITNRLFSFIHNISVAHDIVILPGSILFSGKAGNRFEGKFSYQLVISHVHRSAIRDAFWTMEISKTLKTIAVKSTSTYFDNS